MVQVLCRKSDSKTNSVDMRWAFISSQIRDPEVGMFKLRFKKIDYLNSLL